LSIEKWEPKGKARVEFMQLEKKFGIGESLAMVYCKYNHNVLASSNLKDIKEYCTDNGITYVTTMDLLHRAWIRQLMTEKECDQFISDVIRKGSKLPVRRIKDYKSRGIVL